MKYFSFLVAICTENVYTIDSSVRQRCQPGRQPGWHLFLRNSINMTIFAAGSVTCQTEQKKEETFLQLANRLKNSLLI